ncbi:hypothetical protein A6A03_00035 [Chloroflexus islandicus]|uniref:Uncharacterized protein n=1 Tax=Chloroflexus islandicus TaxID=1707952 RepID=A0A178MEB5_9CHLR|nr:hypothetical protein [Chloroflexus islandicus]OAN47171.1 hypothetical protein A6A03_00035 [Chloroflexus islandicus]
MNSALTLQPRLVLDRPSGSALIARQRLRQTLQRERLLVRDQAADQALLFALLMTELPAASREG